MAVPVVTFAPASGVIASTLAIVVEVTSAPALQIEVLSALLPGVPTTEVIWDGSSFTSPYASGSSRSVIPGGFRYTLRRGVAWPDSPTLSVLAINTSAEQTIAGATYLLSSTVPTPSTPSLPVFSVGSAGAAYPGANTLSQINLLSIIEGTLDPDYIEPIKSVPDGGYELFQAGALSLSRVSASVRAFQIGTLAQFAPVGQFATGTVEFFRVSGGAGSVTVKAGTVVATADDRRFMTLDGAVFSGAALGPVTTRVRALVKSEQWNVPGVRVLPSGDTIPGAISQVRTLVQAPQYGDPTIQVRQIADTTGGVFDWLALLGTELGIPRGQLETDAQYRYRLRTLPDTISPAAVMRMVRTAMSAWGGTFTYIETRDPALQLFYDGRRADHTFVYDDPRPGFPFRNRLLDDVNHLKGFIVVLENLQCIKERGGAYDDTAMNAADARSNVSRGRRALLAYDMESSMTALTSGNVLDGCYDGRDYAKDGVYAGIWKKVNELRAAGVPAAIELKGQ